LPYWQRSRNRHTHADSPPPKIDNSLSYYHDFARALSFPAKNITYSKFIFSFYYCPARKNSKSAELPYISGKANIAYGNNRLRERRRLV
jgi:hypothetical protein